MNDYKQSGEYSRAGGGTETLKIAITFLAIGAGVGALLSLLFSPKSGSEIRRLVRGKLDDARRGLSDQTSRVRRQRSANIAGQTREKVLPISRTQ